MKRNETALTFTKAVHEIQGLLDRLGNEPHEDFEGHGGLCPICGLVTKLRTALREELDELALREHLAAHPTPPSGPPPKREKFDVPGELSPPKTTMFRKRDGSPLIEITLTHTLSRRMGLRRGRSS